MNVRLLLSALFLGLVFSPVFAQTFRPLAGYETLRGRSEEVSLPLQNKVDCGEFDLSAFRLFGPGESRGIRVGTDTTGLGGGAITYQCDGCATAAFGTATVTSDTLFYGADAGAEMGLDTFRIAACNGAGECGPTKRIIVLVRRANQDIDLGNQDIDPRGVIEVVVPDGGLPGGTFCRSIENCAPDYPGRGQRFSFLTGLEDGNDFRYVAAGYRGTDAVCVTICNEFGICDTYRTTFDIDGITANLPFFDDFAYNSNRPRPDLWQDDDVLINRNFADSPPSIGVATFDAVDFSGQPYPPGSGGATTTIRDYLTSVPVNLQGASGTTLSFYLQPRGLGNRPETQDSFLVQFLDQSGNWNTVFSQAGLRTTEPNNSDRPFIGTILNIPAEYQYFGFQFRFAGKSSEQGAVDMWHLDYVKLSESRTSLVVPDLAFVELPEYLLNNYSGIPLRHYRATNDELLRRDYNVAIRNLNNDVLNVSSGSFNILTEVPNSPAVTSPDLTIFFPGNNNAIPGGSLEIRTGDIGSVPGVVADISTYLNTIANPDEPFNLLTLYGMSVNNQDNGFANGGLVRNDTVVQTTTFSEYMAYDDGTAEVTLEGNNGTTILQRYDAFVEDSLKGIRVRIPRGLRSLGSQALRLVVYTGTDVPEILVGTYDFPIVYAEDFHLDSLQGYTTYLLPEALPLEVGTYFVGWEQLRSDANIGIGFDRNSRPDGVQFFNNGNGWTPITGTTTGAIMIRPLLAGFEGFPTSTSAQTSAEDLVDVFPNPTNGTLHLRPRQIAGTGPLNYRLYSITGALLTQDRVNDQIELGHLPAGIYILEVSNGTTGSRHKIVRQ
ncbi:T9SS type A sorting domain-containing protein [Neolewinella persica]|uniref:T9SS type A sorting domain-containing protein n=1 Tax=Neolewinella persica TaxID=70998 RepID=UPI00035CDBD5|nr:T9SS type A sorting domain-containing protein [Neolewinella persica]